MIPVDPDLPNRVFQHVLDAEEIVLWRRQHAVAWLAPAMVFIASLVAGGWARGQVTSAGFGQLVLIGWLAAAAYAIWMFLEWQNFCFVLTDRRVMLFHGVLTRKIAMMPNHKVTDLTYQQTPLGALLRYGDLIIESAGQDQALRQVGYLPHPYRLYHFISQQLFVGGNAKSTPLRVREDD